ncbi:oxalyl-CoA decarboxylase [Paraburkholderia unamae]|uniref:Oxalyl-CoA decarboxylase n=1 Tax=Paraburkholderia unamae TaxID=219649 RepID=A0ABX5KD25_9BURK|nr:oxalyl-CoA decarboxylase [Paraburkholderia unamae]PVX72791.1 oxalyl-CoA decarboxylase [Paraburkholderia unamae]CAG9272478.1 oxalyl-CoA decarboxylase [Paraburkholderia unamae]
MSEPQIKPAATDGFHLVVKALLANRIDTIYGVAGIPITDLARLAQAEGIRYIGFRHEQSAGNAAAISGYLRQWPGVCLTVSAPGFLNGLVALANATTNGFPMIQISGSSDRAIIDLQQGDYEELDQLNAARPYAKAAFRVNRAEDVGVGVARAIRATLSGRPGGVYLDITAAALASTTDEATAQQSLIEVVDPAPARAPSAQSVERALTLLAGAQRPLVILGKGAAYSRAEGAIRGFIEQTGVPFLPMSMAKGILEDDHPLCAAAARSFVLAQADVVMLVGARLNWLLGHGRSPQWSAQAKFIQIDIEPTEFDSNRAIAAPIAGDIASSMQALLAGLPARPVHVPPAWIELVSSHRQHNEAHMADLLRANPVPMNFHCALAAVRDALAQRPDVYVVNEGANTLDVARNLIGMKAPRLRLDAGTWGVMGVGMGYSIGAAVTSGKPVVAIEGDSAFGFSGMEIETICRYRLPVVIVILNNGGIYRGDDINRGPGTDPGATTLMASARYDRMIEAFGGVGYHVERPEALKAALEAALAAGTPALINCVIDPHAGTESGHLKNLNPKSALTGAN